MCRNTDVVPLKDDHEITNEDLSEVAPPELWVPADPTKPPLESEQNDGAGLSPGEMTAFFDDDLLPWYKYANGANGPCNTEKEADYTDANFLGYISFEATGLDYTFNCNQLSGYTDDQDRLCG